MKRIKITRHANRLTLVIAIFPGPLVQRLECRRRSTSLDTSPCSHVSSPQLKRLSRNPRIPYARGIHWRQYTPSVSLTLPLTTTLNDKDSTFVQRSMTLDYCWKLDYLPSWIIIENNTNNTVYHSSFRYTRSTRKYECSRHIRLRIYCQQEQFYNWRVPRNVDQSCLLYYS